MSGEQGKLTLGTSWRLGPLVAALGAALAVWYGPAVSSAHAEAVENLSGCQTHREMGGIPTGRNDDFSSNEEQIGFTISFEGAEYKTLFVNNNGNVSFGQSLSQFTPQAIGSLGVPIIAPFWADVDTRNESSAVTTWGQTEYQGHKAFCVLWDGVGYFAEHADKLNKFQLLLVERPDLGTGAFDIIFKYGQIQWETGDASGGTGGLANHTGTPARVGFGLAGGGSEEIAGSG